MQALTTAEDVVQELLRQRAQARAHGDVATAAVLQRAIATVRRRMPPAASEPAGAA